MVEFAGDGSNIVPRPRRGRQAGSRVAVIARVRYQCRAWRNLNGEGKKLLASNAAPDMKAWDERHSVTAAPTAVGLEG